MLIVKKPVKVLVSDPIAAKGVEKLAQEAEVKQVPGLTEDELVAIIPEFDALVVRSETRVTARVIEASRRLKVIGRAGAGVDNIDVPAASRRGIIVLNAPDGNTIAAAEHTFGLILALSRNIPQACATLKDNKWKRGEFMGVELYDKVLGVIGLGRIGREVAKRARAFGMWVLAYDPLLTLDEAQRLDVEKGELAQVLRAADYLTVHSPLTPETRHLISRDQFALMKDGVRLVNCARGGIVHEEALVEALKSGRVAGAALDVFEKEPAVENSLIKFPNVIVTPHLGASTREAQVKVALTVADQILRALRGEPVTTAVNFAARPERTARTA